MADFIRHYFTPIDPFAMLAWLAVVGLIIIGWVICMIVDRKRK